MATGVVAVNLITNKACAHHAASPTQSILEIDGATDVVTPIAVAGRRAIVINPATNKIYV
jgi:hypothetical protein